MLDSPIDMHVAGGLATAEQRRSFEENGFVILEGFFTADRIAALKDRITQFWAQRSGSPLVIDCYENYPGEVKRLPFSETGDASRAWPYKLNDTHLEDDLVRDFAIDGVLMNILKDLLGATPSACNTLFFERSSEQEAHFDTFYMPSNTPNKMCATWIAIDPVNENNGPLFYYPKSHLIEPFRFSNGAIRQVDGEYPAARAHIARIIEEHGLKPTTFYAKPGDVFIWHAQLLHGGGGIRDMTQTRTSLVTHYWTTLDYPGRDQHLEVGDGRLYLRKGHQPVTRNSERQAIRKFVADLKTEPEYRTNVPEGFDPHSYLLRNLDVFHTGADPYEHYVNYGRSEGRAWS